MRRRAVLGVSCPPFSSRVVRQVGGFSLAGYVGREEVATAKVNINFYFSLCFLGHGKDSR